MQDIRLLIHETCNRFCKDCCNQKPQHDLDNLPIVKPWDIQDAQTVTISGGEPMLNPMQLLNAAHAIRHYNPDCLIYLYTAKVRPPAPLIVALEHFHGVTITLHEPKDLADFLKFMDWMEFRPHWKHTKSLRLNYFPEEGIDLRPYENQITDAGWSIEALQWLEDCPLPENEVFMRWAPPTKKEAAYRKRYHELRISTLGA